MFDEAILNQFLSPSAGPVCISTHLDDTFWDDTPRGFGFFKWNSIDQKWEGTSQEFVDPCVLGPPIGGWNVPSYRPTSVTLSFLAEVAVAEPFPVYPITEILTIYDTDGVELGADSITYTAPNQTKLLTLDMDWAGSAGSAGVGNIISTSSVYVWVKDITCIQFIPPA